MSHKRLWAASAIIACVVVVGFVLSVPHTRDVDTATKQIAVVRVPLVTVRDIYKKGTHTITGAVEAPNACATVTAQASLIGDSSHPNGILVAIAMPEDSGVCLQVSTPISFTVGITAPAKLPITATVNGSIATTTSP